MSLQDARTGIIIYVVASWVSCSLEGLRFGMLFAPGVILLTGLTPGSMSSTISIPGRGYCWLPARWWRQIQSRGSGWLNRHAHHGYGWREVSLCVRWYLDVIYYIFSKWLITFDLKSLRCGIYCNASMLTSSPLPCTICLVLSLCRYDIRDVKQFHI